MFTGGEFLIEPTSDHEAWVTGLHSLGYSSFESENMFKGSVRASCMWGITAVDVGFSSCGVSRADRTQRNVRLDSKDYYKAVFQISGRSTVIQNDRVTDLAVGDCGFVDMTQPSSLVSNNSRWLALYMPRRSLNSHLGLDPRGGVCWHSATPASRLLFRLVLEALREDEASPGAAEPYMQLAVYDLLGAMFAVSDLPPNSSHTEKLFARVCGVAESHFSDPELSLHDVASEAGISLRYVQKLFTARGTTCSRFIQSLRLDHAARLLRRRTLTRSEQPLTEIAYACGFRDYAHFSRMFRLRFGSAPSAVSEERLSANEPMRDIGHRARGETLPN
jgi:AraC family transcriptional activator of tynA and feaB